MGERVISDRAIRAAAAKIAGPTVWAQAWRRPAFENMAASALAAALPHLVPDGPEPRAVITITDEGGEGLDFKLEFFPAYVHDDEASNPDTHKLAAHFMVWMKERLEGQGHRVDDLTAKP